MDGTKVDADANHDITMEIQNVVAEVPEEKVDEANNSESEDLVIDAKVEEDMIVEEDGVENIQLSLESVNNEVNDEDVNDEDVNDEDVNDEDGADVKCVQYVLQEEVNTMEGLEDVKYVQYISQDEANAIEGTEDAKSVQFVLQDEGITIESAEDIKYVQYVSQDEANAIEGTEEAKYVQYILQDEANAIESTEDTKYVQYVSQDEANEIESAEDVKYVQYVSQDEENVIESEEDVKYVQYVSQDDENTIELTEDVKYVQCISQDEENATESVEDVKYVQYVSQDDANTIELTEDVKYVQCISQDEENATESAEDVKYVQYVSQDDANTIESTEDMKYVQCISQDEENVTESAEDVKYVQYVSQDDANTIESTEDVKYVQYISQDEANAIEGTEDMKYVQYVSQDEVNAIEGTEDVKYVQYVLQDEANDIEDIEDVKYVQYISQDEANAIEGTEDVRLVQILPQKEENEIDEGGEDIKYVEYVSPDGLGNESSDDVKYVEYIADSEGSIDTEDIKYVQYIPDEGANDVTQEEEKVESPNIEEGAEITKKEEIEEENVDPLANTEYYAMPVVDAASIGVSGAQIIKIDNVSYEISPIVQNGGTADSSSGQQYEIVRVINDDENGEEGTRIETNEAVASDYCGELEEKVPIKSEEEGPEYDGEANEEMVLESYVEPKEEPCLKTESSESNGESSDSSHLQLELEDESQKQEVDIFEHSGEVNEPIGSPGVNDPTQIQLIGLEYSTEETDGTSSLHNYGQTIISVNEGDDLIMADEVGKCFLVDGDGCCDETTDPNGDVNSEEMINGITCDMINQEGFINHIDDDGDLQKEQEIFDVSTLEELESVLQEYCQRTSSHFVGSSKSRNFGSPSSECVFTGHQISWCDIQNKERSCDDAIIKFDGVPYMIVGYNILHCQFGTNKSAADRERRKAKRAEKGIDVTDHDVKYPTKKCGCPAKINVKQIIRFPEFKIEKDSGWKRRECAARLRQKLNEMRETVAMEMRFVGRLPDVSEHKFHELLQDMVYTKELVLPELVIKAQDLWLEGKTNDEIYNLLRLHVIDEMFWNKEPPDFKMKRYYPTRKDIRNYISRVYQICQFRDVQKESIKDVINGILLNEPSTNVSFDISENSLGEKDGDVDSSDEEVATTTTKTDTNEEAKVKKKEGDKKVETFLFCFQTPMQQRLMKKYNNVTYIVKVDTLKPTKRVLTYVMYALLVQTNVDYQVVGTILVSKHRKDGFQEGLNIFREWNSFWTPKYFLVDYCEVLINAISAVFTESLYFINAHACEKQWLDFILTPSNDLEQHSDELLKYLKNMQYSLTEESLSIAALLFEQSEVWQNSEKFRTWFQTKWLPLAKYWVLGYRPEDLLILQHIKSSIEGCINQYQNALYQSAKFDGFIELLKSVVTVFPHTEYEKYVSRSNEAYWFYTRFREKLHSMEYMQGVPITVLPYVLDVCELATKHEFTVRQDQVGVFTVEYGGDNTTTEPNDGDNGDSIQTGENSNEANVFGQTDALPGVLSNEKEIVSVNNVLTPVVEVKETSFGWIECSKAMDPGEYTVSFGDATSYPFCTCAHWMLYRLPCVHMFAVFIKVPGWRYDMLSPLYRYSDVLHLDCSCIANSQVTKGVEIGCQSDEYKESVGTQTASVESDIFESASNWSTSHFVLKEAKEFLSHIRKNSFLFRNKVLYSQMCLQLDKLISKFSVVRSPEVQKNKSYPFATNNESKAKKIAVVDIRKPLKICSLNLQQIMKNSNTAMSSQNANITQTVPSNSSILKSIVSNKGGNKASSKMDNKGNNCTKTSVANMFALTSRTVTNNTQTSSNCNSTFELLKGAMFSKVSSTSVSSLTNPSSVVTTTNASSVTMATYDSLVSMATSSPSIITAKKLPENIKPKCTFSTIGTSSTSTRGSTSPRGIIMNPKQPNASISTVNITKTPTVNITKTPTVNISKTPVNISKTFSSNISKTPSLIITRTPTEGMKIYPKRSNTSAAVNTSPNNPVENIKPNLKQNIKPNLKRANVEKLFNETIVKKQKVSSPVVRLTPTDKNQMKKVVTVSACTPPENKKGKYTLRMRGSTDNVSPLVKSEADDGVDLSGASNNNVDR